MQFSKSKKSPENVVFSPDHNARITAMYSSRRLPRSSNGTLSAANSSASQPAPTPSTMRPPERWSSVANSFAVITGLRCGTMRMPVANLMRVVCAATQVSQISGSGRSNSSAPPAILPLGS
jgi:hypothetical protein